MSKSISVARSGQTDRAEDYWFNQNEATYSAESIDEHYLSNPELNNDGSATQRVATPDDIRLNIF